MLAKTKTTTNAMTFEDLARDHVDFPTLQGLVEAGRVPEDDLKKYCAFQGDFSRSIAREMKTHGTSETMTVREVLTGDALVTLWDGALERARNDLVLQ
jgi:hypothetical protein